VLRKNDVLKNEFLIGARKKIFSQDSQD